MSECLNKWYWWLTIIHLYKTKLEPVFEGSVDLREYLLLRHRGDEVESSILAKIQLDAKELGGG